MMKPFHHLPLLVSVMISICMAIGCKKDDGPKPKNDPGNQPQDSTIFYDARDGQTYSAVKINGVWWMAENLNYKSPGSVCFDFDTSYGPVYGRLYSWQEAKSAVPEGWRLPVMDDWNGLINYLGGPGIAGYRLKEDQGVGFNALMSGTKSNGAFDGLKGWTCFWSADEKSAQEANCLLVNGTCDNVTPTTASKSNKYAVRLIRE